ncbi:MAG: hypothetical protein CSA66_00590 [Proteobacteria bacterium]|nr:MAG: hypothetical protein CSA66_00590 [Pseudomonadota bacterium]
MTLFITAFMLVPLSLALLGAWVGTTLPVFNDGPVWLAIIGAVVAFFLLPLGWELWADRKQRGGRIRDAILRSSFLSAVFLVVLIGTHPKDTFEALATRGDWFLAGSKSETAQSVRGVLFTLADGLEWLNDWVRTKAFVDIDQSGEVDPGDPEPWRTVGAPGVPIPGSELTWPLPAVVSPTVASMPASAQASIASVGAYIAEHEPDPFMRVKAVHDFVATWVSYDYPALRDGSYRTRGLQEAERVFERRKGVCSGYSRLAVAVGEAAGAEIIVIRGDARNPDDYEGIDPHELPADGAGHAWNAAKINGDWYAFDATWDTSGAQEDGSPGEYETTYLFTPPQALILDHRPDEDRWQQLDAPLSRGEWLRQPLLRPTVVAYGLDVEEPDRPIERSTGQVRARVSNPNRAEVQIGVAEPGEAAVKICAKSTDERVALTCDVAPGRWQMGIFVGAVGQRARWVGGARVEVD